VANDVTLTMEPIAAFSGDPLDGGRVSAAKTGTEGIQSGKYSGGNSDAWMVGFTPQVSAAVWVGSGDSTHPIVDSNGGAEYGRDLPGRTWQLFMNTYLAGKPNLAMPTKQQVHASTDARSSSKPPSSSSSSKPTPTLSSSSSTSAPPSTSVAPPSTSGAPSTSTVPLPTVTLPIPGGSRSSSPAG
jgi:membrane peptidoglycan carboxypeptidase